MSSSSTPTAKWLLYFTSKKNYYIICTLLSVDLCWNGSEQAGNFGVKILIIV
jgi:hypothetical protein